MESTSARDRNRGKAADNRKLAADKHIAAEEQTT
jgi:hypothetical protein